MSESFWHGYGDTYKSNGWPFSDDFNLPQREWLKVQYYSIYKMETALCFLAMSV